jgi:predicted phage terminase large subunit-like protein
VLNLVRDRWLPARRADGSIETIAPWEITDRLDDDPIVGFAWPRADFDGATHEFLIGLLATAAAPNDDEEWPLWWEAPPGPDLLRDRFVEFTDAFFLDGDGPRFMQDMDPLEGEKEVEVGGLLIDAPGEETLRKNADLFVKRGGVRVLSRAAATMALFTLQTYAPKVDPLGTIYIIDWWRGQTVTDIWVERQCDLILKHQPLCWFGEKGVIEKAVRPYLTHRMNERRAYCRIEWLPSVTEKTARARSFQALASMNKVMVPVEAPWKAELLGQLTRFPAGRYDDGVDVCSLIGRGLKIMPTPAAIGPGRNRRPGRYHRSSFDPYAYTQDEMPGVDGRSPRGVALDRDQQGRW